MTRIFLNHNSLDNCMSLIDQEGYEFKRKPSSSEIEESEDAPKKVKMDLGVKPATDEQTKKKEETFPQFKDIESERKPRLNMNTVTMVIAVLSLLIALVSLYMVFTKPSVSVDGKDFGQLAQDIQALKDKRIKMEIDTSQPIIIGGNISIVFPNQSMIVPVSLQAEGTLRGYDQSGKPITINVDYPLFTTMEVSSFPSLDASFYSPSNVSSTIVVDTTLGDLIGPELDRIADSLK